MSKMILAAALAAGLSVAAGAANAGPLPAPSTLSPMATENGTNSLIEKVNYYGRGRHYRPRFYLGVGGNRSHRWHRRNW